MNLSAPFARLLAATGFLTRDHPADGLLVREGPHEHRPFNRHDFLFAAGRFPLKVDALFRCHGTPIVIFKDAMIGAEPTDRELREWHALSWNFSLAPLLWVATPSRVMLLNSYAPPQDNLHDLVLVHFEFDQLFGRVNETISGVCGRLAFDTGAFWRSSCARRLDRRKRVDAVLVRDLADLEASLRALSLDALLSQKLIGRALFSQYLVDRKLLGPEQLGGRFGATSLPALLRDPSASRRLFRWMKVAFNGDLFPPDVPGEDELIRSIHLGILADFLDGVEPASGQRRLFPYRFDVIPVELISSIYEQFAHSAAGKEAASQGLHYTPTNLVDLILDMIFDGLGPDTTVLDPACGSGVFLVESFRRLVWKRSQREGRSRRVVRDVLHNQIFGVDVNAAALEVTAFSLYLAALELDPDVSQGFEWLKFDHLIGRSLYCGSFLAPSMFPERRFDLIVGNPPWTYAGRRHQKQKAESERQRVAQPRRSPDWGFLWRARDHAHRNTIVALLMKATPFFSKDQIAGNARRQLFADFRDVRLVNMAQLRTENLFPPVGRSGHAEGKGQRAITGPALLFVGRLGTARSDEQVTLVNVPWMQTFRRNGVFELAPEMFKQFSVAQIATDPVLLKAAMQGNGREFEVMNALLASPRLVRLGAWVDTLGAGMEQGFQLQGGGRSTTTNLLGLPTVDADTYRALRLPHHLPPFQAAHAHRPRDARIYRGPLLLCPESGFGKALERGRYSAAVSACDVAYNDSFVGLSLKGHDPIVVHALCAILNSKVVAFQLAFGGSNMGLKQPKVEKVDLEEVRIPDLLSIDRWLLKGLKKIEAQLATRASGGVILLQRLDELVYEAYDLGPADRRVIDDVLARSRPIFIDSRTERTYSVGGVDVRQFLKYGAELTHTLDTTLSENDTFRVPTNRVIRLAPDVVAMRFDLQKGPVRPLGAFGAVKPELFEAPLIELLGGATLPRFHNIRFLRIYADRTVYVVKPDERRYWQASDAQVDAQQILENREFRHAVGLDSDLPIGADTRPPIEILH